MTFSLLKAQALLKARQHKYTHRKLVGRDPKTNRKRYRYYYAEHHGGGITSAEIEAGSAFKLTFKGRRGHFHVQSVEGDTVTVRHDGRPNSKPVEMTKAEFRALLKRQHETVENKKREKAQENRRRGRKKRKGSKRTKRKTTPQTQAPEQTPQVQDPEQGADDFETMPEVESVPAQTTFPLLGMDDEIDYSIRTLIGGSTHTQATEKVARHLSDLNARAEQEIKQGADRAAVKKLFTEHARAFKELTQKLEDSTTPRKRAFVQKKMDTLLDNPPSVIRNEPAKGAISPEILDSKYTWFANRVPQAEDLGITPAERVDLITALEKFNERDRDLANEIAIEIRDNPKSASVQRAVRALLESQGETYETMPEPEAQPTEPAEREVDNVGGLSDEEVKEMDDAVDRFRFTPEEIQSMNLDELAEIREAFTEVFRDPRRKYYNDPEYQRLREAIEEARAIANADRNLPMTDVHAAEDALSAFEERYTERYVTPLRSLITPIDERLTRLQRNKRARERRAEKKQRAQEQAERQARREERERKKREEQARIDEATNRRMIAQDDAREMLGESRKYSGSPAREQFTETAREVEPKRNISEEDFDTLKSGDRIKITYHSSFSGNVTKEFEIGRKSKSKRYAYEALRLYPIMEDGNPRKSGMKTILRKRKGTVSMARGDLAVSVKEFTPPTKVQKSLNLLDLYKALRC